MSILSQEINSARKELIRGYYQSLNDMERYRYLELKAAITIQKNIRRFLCERRLNLLRKFSLDIQKFFKGFLARAQHMQSVKDLSNDMNMQFYEYHFTIIQKHWRGFNTRRNKLDYQERKKYLQKIKQKNEETLIKVQEYSRAVQYDLERKKEEQHRKNFNDVASHLHHLVSTKAIPGVYNPANIPEELKPQVFNADIETHLKAVFKNNIKAIGSKKKLIGQLGNSNTIGNSGGSGFSYNFKK